MSESILRLTSSKSIHTQTLNSKKKVSKTKVPKTSQEIELRAKYKMKSSFAAILTGICISHLAFVVPNLIFAYQETQCVTTTSDTFQFNLRTWLEVDAYSRIALIMLILLIVIGMSLKKQRKVLKRCVSSFILLYSIFSFAWVIIGSIIFWGQVNRDGLCTGSVQAYMWSFLIISYVLICFFCVMNGNRGLLRWKQT